MYDRGKHRFVTGQLSALAQPLLNVTHGNKQTGSIRTISLMSKHVFKVSIIKTRG